MNYKQGWACKKYRKKGKDEYMRRLSSYRKILVKKDWKTTLCLFPDYATDVE